MNKGLLLLLVAALAPLPATAHSNNQLALDNLVFVERISTDASGKQRVRLEQPREVAPGDRLVFVLNYRNAGNSPTERFVITNPMPAAVRYADAGTDRPLVSVDGGQSWGHIEDLSVSQADGRRRSAQPADVTHVRWTLQKPVPAGGSGKLIFRGVVR